MDRGSGVDLGAVDTAQVEYAVVVVPRASAVSVVLSALADTARAGAIRVLDCAVVTRDELGAITTEEVSSADLGEAEDTARPRTALLSHRDLEMAATVIPRGNAGLVVVLEVRWAAPLAAAARSIDGWLVAGERIPANRLTAVLADRRSEDER